MLTAEQTQMLRESPLVRLLEAALNGPVPEARRDCNDDIIESERPAHLQIMSAAASGLVRCEWTDLETFTLYKLTPLGLALLAALDAAEAQAGKVDEADLRALVEMAVLQCHVGACPVPPGECPVGVIATTTPAELCRAALYATLGLEVKPDGNGGR